MGYLMAMGPCYGCGEVIAFNPERVPSVSIDGHLHPICRECVARINPMREANGLPPVVLLPGAYDPEQVE